MQPKPKRIPMRMCVGCREMKPKKELVRVVRPPEGDIRFDLTGKAPGRGAYICRRRECLMRARKIRALERALEMRIDDSLWDRLEKEIEPVEQ